MERGGGHGMTRMITEKERCRARAQRSGARSRNRCARYGGPGLARVGGSRKDAKFAKGLALVGGLAKTLSSQRGWRSSGVLTETRRHGGLMGNGARWVGPRNTRMARKREVLVVLVLSAAVLGSMARAGVPANHTNDANDEG
jgi:hypothetical protein